MRKFALLPLFFGLVGFGSAQAQVRDLFAEFEQEAKSSAAETPAPASSSAMPAAQTSAPVPSSSSVAVNSVATVPVSSSSVFPTSSVASPASSAALSSSVEAVSSSAISSSSAVVAGDTVSRDSAVATTGAPDSLANVGDSTKIADSSSVKPDSLAQAYVAQKNAAVDSARARDSLAALSSSSALNLSSSSMSRRDLLGPVKVSKVHSIDEMKGKYKSPRKALFMSLVLPGSGQLYVGGSKFTYARGVVYLAIEASLWTGWYYNSVYRYDKQVDKYKKFANEHYSIGRYENGMYDLFMSLPDAEEENRFVERYMNNRQSFCEARYGSDSKRSDCYSTNQRPYDENIARKNYTKNPQPLEKESKEGFYESSEVYQMIGGSSFVLGWDDVDSVVVASGLDLGDPNSEIVSLGSSKNREEYRSMRNDANDLANMQAWFIGGLILNHLVSAVDAALTANAHNKTLYEEDLSWYDRLHFDSGFSFNRGFGVDVRASWGF